MLDHQDPGPVSEHSPSLGAAPVTAFLPTIYLAKGHKGVGAWSVPVPVKFFPDATRLFPEIRRLLVCTVAQ